MSSLRSVFSQIPLPTAKTSAPHTARIVNEDLDYNNGSAYPIFEPFFNETFHAR